MADHASVNRDYWNGMAEDWVTGGERLWSASPRWGIWGLPEADLRLLPEDMTGLATIELGCGTGYVSGWMAKRGAQATGIDIADAQLATARRLAGEHGTPIDFIEGNAEDVPRPDAAFDFAISEYGAAIWCDPEKWLPEAWRLLRPGGRLVFLGNHPLAMICSPLNGAVIEPVLHRSYRTLRRLDWTEVEIDPGGIEFNRPISAWMDLFRQIGFRIDDYHELFAPPEATGTQFYMPAEMAKDFPSEQVWCLRKPA